ncbi:GNAT family N-acetyltransferase [Streptomyces sp. NPDC001594]|uniref:GNAT family N-acetyltransferase n=1 Tax=Streptomyces sp. NPDC001594 TaxID=3364590 RepID=UPI0036839748
MSVTTPRVELRWPSQHDLDDLADRGAEGVHDPAYMPFFSQWTDGDQATVAKRVLQRHWGALGSWTPEDWTLYLAVVHEGTVVGSQSLGARNFATAREVLLTSWLGYRFHGMGLGTQARAAALHLAFEGLGADYAVVVVRQDNGPSQRVCEKFGFLKDGTQINSVRGTVSVSDRYRLDRERWEARREITAEIRGLEAGRTLFGLDGGIAEPAAPASRVSHASTLSGVHYLEESDQEVG